MFLFLPVYSNKSGQSSKGIIERITICMERPPMKYPAVFVVKQPDVQAFNVHRREFFAKLIALPKAPTNNVAVFGDVGAPYGFVFVDPVYGNIDSIIKSVADMTSQRVEDISESIVTDIAAGRIGFRRAPEEITNQYKALIKIEDKKI